MYPIVAEIMVKCLWPGGDSLLLICVCCKLLVIRVLFGRVQRNGNHRTPYDQLGFQGLCNIQSCAFTQDSLLWGEWHWWCIAADAAIDTVFCASVNGTLCLSHHLLSSHCFSPFPILSVPSLQLSEQWLVSDNSFTTHPTMPLFRVTSAHLGPFQNSDWLTPFQPAPNRTCIPFYPSSVWHSYWTLWPLKMEGTEFFKIVGNESPCAIHIPEYLNPHSLVDLVNIDRSVSWSYSCNLEYTSENIISKCG